MTPIVERTKRPEGATWDRQEIKDWYRRAKAERRRRGLAGPVTAIDCGGYLSAFIREFETVQAMQAACGDEPRPPGRPRTP